MTTYQIAYNRASKVAVRQANEAALPTGYIKLGTYKHDEAGDTISEDAESHVLYQHVQDLLYRLEDVEDMAAVKIFLNGDFVALQSFVLSPDPLEMNVGEIKQLYVVPTPANASNTSIKTFVSSNQNVVAVDPTGLATALTTGEVTITATSADGNKIDTLTITSIGVPQSL